jgi:hypothetical protein
MTNTFNRPTEKRLVWQNANGTWRHLYSQVEWADRAGAETDLRFTVESDPATYDCGRAA